MKNREKLLSLVDKGFFSHETLLNEIVVAMSSVEAQEMLEHIIDMHSIEEEEV